MLKRDIVETMGSIEFNESQLAQAKDELAKRNAKNQTGMTTNELRGKVAFLTSQLQSARSRLPQMKEELSRLIK
jgi:hypothetical protein